MLKFTTPKHAGGTDVKDNQPKKIISQLIGYVGKSLAMLRTKRLFEFQLRKKENEALRFECVKALQKQWKSEKKNRFDSEKQRALGLKGGAKGGFANTEAQYKARSTVGKQYGRIAGKANQKPKLIEFLQKYSIWEFKGCVKEI